MSNVSAVASVKSTVVCLDLEGVLIPEIWIAVAGKTGIKELTRTTRDEPNYDKLMSYRLNILKKNGIKLRDVQRVIAGLSPLPGAQQFVKKLKASAQLIILSDTFYEFAGPLMKQLDYPTLFCHRLKISSNGYIQKHILRQSDQKRKAVKSLQKLNFRVCAAGDSYNDTTMLLAADKGVLYRPPLNVIQDFPQLPVSRNYSDLYKKLGVK